MDDPLVEIQKFFWKIFLFWGWVEKRPPPLFFYGGIEGILEEGIGRYRKFWAFWTGDRTHPQGMNIGRGGSKGLWGVGVYREGYG